MFWRSILRRAVPPASQHVAGGHQARASLPHSTTTTGKLRDRARFVASTLLWMPVVIMFNEIVAEVTWINGASMYPYFNADKDSTTRNDVVLNYKFKAQEGLKRGMIVTFWNPTNPESTAVKRIVGLEGDVVRTRSPWPEPAAKVPEFHVWVQGDGSARDNLDSNTYGPVPVGLITGKVTHILYPFAKAGRVRWWEHNVEKTKTPRP